jgi:hydrogenase expression/formation protein HypC
MCLAVPGKIVSVNGMEGVVDVQGIKRKVNLTLIDGAKVGDWVIVHVGYAIRKLSERDARETLRLIEEILASTV